MQKEIHLIFNPGKGNVSIRNITAVAGDRVGAMPRPVRKGYRFEGWFTFPEGADIPADGFGGKVLPEHTVDSRFDGDTVLYAHWKKISAKDRKKSSLRTQRKAVIALAVAIVLLIGTLIFVNYIVDIYTYPDLDGTEYTIKKKNGKYALFLDGEMCDVNLEGFYQTKLGTLLDIDPDTGKYEIYAVVHTSDTELLGHNRRVLMFKQLTYDSSSTKDSSRVIKEISLRNEYGEMKLVRAEDSRFEIEGFEGLLLNENTFATLASACGYTISSQRLESPARLPDGSVDLSEYGLVSEVRTKIEYPDGEESDGSLSDMVDKEGGVEVSYLYEPVKYTITTMTGDSYTVTIGDLTPTGGGYYALYEGRDTIYVLNSTNITEGVMIPVENLVTPMIVLPSGDEYFNVSDFNYRSDIDYEEIYITLLCDMLDLDREQIENLSDEELAEYEKQYEAIMETMDDEEFAKKYDAALLKHSTLITSVSFIPNSERDYQLYATSPFKVATDYMAGYLPNAENIISVMQQLNTMTFNKVVALGPTDEELDEYGITEAAHIFSYYLNADDDSVYNYVKISDKRDGVYYAYSPEYNMIVEFADHQAPYLEWEDIDWYRREFIGYNIVHVKEIIVEGKDVNITFRIDNSASGTRDNNGNFAYISDKMEVYANGEKLDYSIYITKPSGSVSKENALYNFKRFFSQALGSASLEGMAELSEDEINGFKSAPDSDCYLKITIIADDSAYVAKDSSGNPTREVNSICNVYRFYQYTERKAFMTVEALGSADNVSNGENADGRFYVSRSFCDKILADALRVINAQEIKIDAKY